MKNIVILISGRGSNMEAMLDAKLPCRIAAVISNKADARGLETARAHGIPTAVVAHAEHASRELSDAALAAEIDRHRPDLVVLAGVMRILGEAFVRRYAGRLMNIHPSLLPAFPGLDTHRRALAAGCRVHGCTVHFVTPALDNGPVVIQAAVPVHADDSEAALAARAAELLSSKGLEVSVDEARGIDHGLFIPMMLSFPEADIPMIEMSVEKSFDPQLHLDAGKALAPLRSEGVLIVGSGMSFHNMRGYGYSRFTAPSEAFDNWLTAAAESDPDKREALLASWRDAPSGRLSHPREEHLLPLMVAAGASSGKGRSRPSS